MTVNRQTDIVELLDIDARWLALGNSPPMTDLSPRRYG